MPKLRKNIYRSRKEKKGVLAKPKINSKSKIFDDNRLHLHYRNQTISLIAILGKRQYLFNFFKGKKIGIQLLPMKPHEIVEKLQKQLDGKGRDKTRKNFNHLTNEQLRSLKYKQKPLPPVKKENKGRPDQDDVFDEEEGENQEE